MKLSGKLPIGLAIAAALITATLSLAVVFNSRSSGSKTNSSVAEAPTPVPSRSTIAALGRLEPAGGVFKVAAPSSLGSARVFRLLVKEGSQVRVNQPLAIMDTNDRLEAAVLQAEAQVKEAESRLAQVKAGAKQGDIQAQAATIRQLQADLTGEVATQKATIARLKAEKANADLEYRRYQQLHRDGAISTSQMDSKRLELDQSIQRFSEASANLSRIESSRQQQIQQASSTLASVSEIRPTDIQQAEAALEVALANLQRAQADLETAIVRAPVGGQILKIHADPGEIVGEDGIAELGNTNIMEVVAEVYATDVALVKLGQKATITSSAFPGEIAGEVTQVGKLIFKNDVLNTDPAADTDTRVVEVKIRLQDSQAVAGLSNLQVNVKIER